MANKITDEVIEYVGALAELELNDEEKIQAQKDMEMMLDYIDSLNELDTSDVEPMSHVFSISNVFRKDEVTNSDSDGAATANAPEVQDDAFVVSNVFG